MRIFSFRKPSNVRIMNVKPRTPEILSERIRPMDPFENYGNDHRQGMGYQGDPNAHAGNMFPDFNSQWKSPVDEGIKTRVGGGIEKGTDVAKKASNFYLNGILLIVLLILLPPILRFAYEFSSWLFNNIGYMFH